MATMSYCAFENTASDMRISVDKLENLDGLDDLNDYERRGFKALMELCRDFLEMGESLES